MARDSQAALVALNRFGLGARGGASGDFVNAASDPRGFVKAELNRPSGALLEAPGLQSTPALAQTVFAYQFEIVQARNAAAKSGADRRSVANGAAGHRRQSRRDGGNRRQRRDGSGRGDAAAEAGAGAAQHHPENLPRRGAGAVAAHQDRRLRIRRAPRGVLVQPFLHLRQQGRHRADVGGLVRARGDPALCAGPLRRHAQGGGAASGDAVLSRQPAIARVRSRAPDRTASAA